MRAEVEGRHLGSLVLEIAKQVEQSFGERSEWHCAKAYTFGAGEVMLYSPHCFSLTLLEMDSMASMKLGMKLLSEVWVEFPQN